MPFVVIPTKSIFDCVLIEAIISDRSFRSSGSPPVRRTLLRSIDAYKSVLWHNVQKSGFHL
jgi:hypothetical protein